MPKSTPIVTEICDRDAHQAQRFHRRVPHIEHQPGTNREDRKQSKPQPTVSEGRQHQNHENNLPLGEGQPIDHRLVKPGNPSSYCAGCGLDEGPNPFVKLVDFVGERKGFDPAFGEDGFGTVDFPNRKRYHQRRAGQYPTTVFFPDFL